MPTISALTETAEPNEGLSSSRSPTSRLNTFAVDAPTTASTKGPSGVCVTASDAIRPDTKSTCRSTLDRY